MVTTSLDVVWELVTWDESEYRHAGRKLHAWLKVNGYDMHLEAIEVRLIPGGVLVAARNEDKAVLEALEILVDGSPETFSYLGCEWVMYAFPHQSCW